MGGHRRKHLATDTFDVAGPQMMPEQAGDIGRARGMAKGRRKLRPGEDGVGRQEAGSLVRAKLHLVYNSVSKRVLNTHLDA